MTLIFIAWLLINDPYVQGVSPSFLKWTKAASQPDMDLILQLRQHLWPALQTPIAKVFTMMNVMGLVPITFVLQASHTKIQLNHHAY